MFGNSKVYKDHLKYFFHVLLLMSILTITKGNEMKQKKDTYILIDNKKQRDSEGKIILYTYKEAKHVYKKLQTKGVNATCETPIYFSW